MRNIFDYIRQQHFWRKATFNEMSALYVTQSLRVLALSLSSSFIYMYLFKQGFSLPQITLFILLYTLTRAISNFPLAFLLSKVGTKRALLIGSILQIPTLIIFAFINQLNINYVYVGLVFQAISEHLYSLAYNIIFSEFKNSSHSGKEIGFMLIFQRFSKIIAPVVGGFLMTINYQFTIISSSVILAFSSLPLFKTTGGTRKRYDLNFKSFPWDNYKLIFYSEFGREFNYVTSAVWSVFATAFLIIKDDYECIGLISSVSSIVGLITALIVGKIMDKSTGSKGKKIFYFSIIFHSIIIAGRPFVGSFFHLALLSVIIGISTTFYQVVIFKAQFDAADKSGSRIIYETYRHMAWAVSASIASVVLYLLLILPIEQEISFKIFFGLTSVMFLLIMIANYPLFREKEVKRGL